MDWSQLHGSHGVLPDAPIYFRGLYSSSDQEYERALTWLSNNLVHQGTRWQATHHSVPYFLEALNTLTVPERKHAIIDLLLYIALNEWSNLLPHGIEVDQFFAPALTLRFTEEEEYQLLQSKDWDELNDKDYERVNQLPDYWRYQAYLAVEEGISTFLMLAKDANQAVRKQSTFSLAWFPRKADITIPVVRHCINNESDPYLIANAILTLGVLARSKRDMRDIPLLETFLASDQPFILRCTAAMSLAKISADQLNSKALDILISAIDDRETLQAHQHHLLWYEEIPLVGHIYQILYKTLGL
jgi:hypothetical protein